MFKSILVKAHFQWSLELAFGVGEYFCTRMPYGPHTVIVFIACIRGRGDFYLSMQ